MCCQNTDEVYICVASKYRWILYMCWLNIDEVYMCSLKIKIWKDLKDNFKYHGQKHWFSKFDHQVSRDTDMIHMLRCRHQKQ